MIVIAHLRKAKLATLGVGVRIGGARRRAGADRGGQAASGEAATPLRGRRQSVPPSPPCALRTRATMGAAAAPQLKGRASAPRGQVCERLGSSGLARATHAEPASWAGECRLREHAGRGIGYKRDAAVGKLQ
eukprot:scaffold4100_cov372-Prasinococcus_capsulatus_cf.AAC.8